MPGRIQFECFKSLSGGFVAYGRARGEMGARCSNRQVCFGCQGESWEELQANIRRLVISVAPDITLNPTLAPIEIYAKPWPPDEPLLASPHANIGAMFRGLADIGRSLPGRANESGGVTQVLFQRETYFSYVCPTAEWKPELISGLLRQIESVLPERTEPTSEAYSRGRDDVIAEILSNAIEG